MRVSLFYLILLPAVPAALTGQLNLVEHLIDGDVHGTASLYACDMDQDGDLDILGASYEENTIDWWRNEGGSPIAWTRIIIAYDFLQAGSVYAGDLDGDSRTDVMAAARIGDEVAWWHNDGSDSVPWTKYTIRSNYDFAHEVYACDLDQDGDTDVMGAASYGDEITWWRNEGGNPIQWTEQTIGAGFAGAKSVHAADIDADSALDVVGAAIFDNDITWWRNGGGNPIQWTEYLIDGNFYGAHRVQAIDIDLDGRCDILGAAYFGNEIAWWRNDGGNPPTWTRQSIGTGFNSACVAQAVDLDNDGDMDVVATAQASNQVAWWRNDGGNPIQWTKFVIDYLVRTWPLYCCDLDQDGDTDVIAGSGWAGTNQVKWYENRGTAIAENGKNVKPCVRISSMIIRDDIDLPKGRACRIFDASGRAVTLRRLPNGIYYLMDSGAVRARIVKIR